MRNNQTKGKKIISLLLSVLMLLSAVPIADLGFVRYAQAQSPAFSGDAVDMGDESAPDTPVTVVACSDYQYRNSDVYGVGATGNAGGAIVVGNIVSQMQSAGIASADGFLCCGDYDYDLGSGADAAGGIASLKSAVSPIAGSAEYVLVQGNHDPQSTAGGTSPSGDNDPASGAYGVFVINERDYQWGQRVIEDATLAAAENLRRYLNSKIAVDYTAPIFVISHLPLHYSMRSNQDGDNIYAKILFDVLQDGAAQGLNIIFLFGHNHSNGWDDYLGGPKIFLAPGESINIAEPGSKTSYTTETLGFVYMNAGYTGYWERYNTATAATSMNFNIEDLSMTTFTISKSSVVINRYGTAGATNLKNAGMRNWHKNEQNLNPAYPVTENTVSSPYTLSLTEAVDDSEYEIDPVVYADATATVTSGGMVYPRITDASQLVDGGKYLIVLSGRRNGVLDNTYFLTDTQKAHGTSGGNNEADGMVVAATPDGFANGDSVSGDFAAYEWTLRRSEDQWVICSKKGELTLTGSADHENYFDVGLSANGTPLSFIYFADTRPDEFFIGTNLSYNGGAATERNLNYSNTVFAYSTGHRYNATFAVYGSKAVGNSVIEPYPDRSVTPAVYPRITDPSQIVDGEKYVMVVARTRSDANVRQLISRESIDANDRTGFRLDAVPDGFSLGSVIEGALGDYEWTMVKSGSGWKLACSAGQLTLSQRGSTQSYNGTLTSNGNVFTLEQYASGLWYFKTTVGGVTLRLDKNLNGNLVNSYDNGEGANNVVIALYGTKNVSGTVTAPYTSRTAAPAVYPRITDVSQLVDGERYVLIMTGIEDTSNNYTAWDQKYLLNHTLKTASNLTGFDIKSAPFTGTVSDTIEGAYGAYEFVFSRSGDQWLLSDASGQVTLTRQNTSASFNVSYTSSGTAFNIVSSSQNGLFKFTANVSGYSNEVVVDHNESSDIVNAYRHSSSGRRAVFAIYGAKQDPDSTIQRYVKETVNTTSDLDEDGKYVIVNGTNAITPADTLRATPVVIHTDDNGDKYLEHSQNVSLEFTWKRNSSNSQNFDFFNGSNQKLQVSRSGGSQTTYTYDLVNSLEDGETYVIVYNNNTAVSSTVSSNKLQPVSVTVSGTQVTSTVSSNIEWVWSLDSVQSGYTSGYLKTGNNWMYIRGSNRAGLATTSQKVRTNFSNNTTRLWREGNSNTNYLYYNGGAFGSTTTASSGSTFRFYKKTPHTSYTYTIGMGTDTAQYLQLTNVNTTNHTARILLNSGGTGNNAYTRYIGAPVQTEGYLHFTESDTGADFEFYRLQNVNVPGQIHEIQSTVTATAEHNSPIESVTISGREATLYVGAAATTYTGLYFNVRYKSDAKAVTEEQIPIKVGDLLDYSGHNGVAAYCGEPGDVPGLGAFYDALDGYWFSDLILHLIQKEDYPEYPNEGSVRVNKTAGAPDFMTNGVTRVELSATGVPMTQGVDIVLMLDTSSSMSNTVNGVTRLAALQSSVAAMLDALNQPNETTGQAPDISLAIADFNGYYDTSASFGTTDTYVSRDDVPDGTTPRTTTNAAQHCTILTGPNAGTEVYNNDAFVPVGELTDTSSPNYFNSSTQISLKSGTNYDQALETVYKLFEARQAYNASQQQERQTVVIFMSDGGPFQYNFFTSQSTTYRWNYWLMGTYDDTVDSIGTTVSGEPAASTSDSSDNNTIYQTYLNNHNDLNELMADYNNGGHWYFYNGKGNPNRYAQAIKGDPAKKYTVLTKDPTAFCNDRNSDGFCDLCGKCNGDCVDHDHDGICDLCGHIDQCVHSNANGDDFCDICGECMDGCQTYQYMTQVSGLGATVYSIMFCKIVDKQISTDAMDHIITDIASDPSKAYPDAQSAEDLTNAFLEIASNFVQAGSSAYFTDTIGPAYDLQTATVYTKNSGEDAMTFNLDPRPNIEFKKYKVYTEADFLSGRISNRDQIGVRTGEVQTIETVTFNDDGTQGYSDLLGNNVNIYNNGIINAKTFIYNNTTTTQRVDTDGDGVADYDLPAETFYWKIGIIEDTEFALCYWVYLTGSMEGTRDAGSYPTNTQATLYYDNYLDHPCYLETISPVMAWLAATITYEFYLVNADGDPVNSAGQVVPFTNRVLIGNQQTETFHLNSSAGQSADGIYVSAAQGVPEVYTLYNPNAQFHVALYSGADATNNYATISDNVPKANDPSSVTTYFYDSDSAYNKPGQIRPSQHIVDDYGNTHVAFAVLLKTTIVPDTVVIDYGLPVKIHVLMNDLNLPTGTRINAVGTQFTGEENQGYTSQKLSDGARTLTLPNGTADVVNGDTTADVYVKYTPKDMTMEKEDTFYYEVFFGGSYYYAKVTVIPAENIYYEDSFLNFIDGSDANAAYKWKTAGETYTNVYQAEDRPGYFALSTYDANNVYGNDAAYDDEVATYSLGSAEYVTVDANCKVTPVEIAPRAEFTFCGTGFDVISVTSGYTGALTVTVKNASGGTVKKQVVNTFYGYSYGRLYLTRDGRVTLRETNDEGEANRPLYTFANTVSFYTPIGDPDEKLVRVNGRVFTTKDHSDDTHVYDYAYGWLTETASTGVLYQIPVISLKGFDYGVYTVTIQPRYAASMNMTHNDYYEVYVDAIRIYDPAGVGEGISTVVNEAYNKDNEANAVITTIHDTVIKDRERFLQETSGVGDTEVGGTIMVDGMFVTATSATALTDFMQSGPNNEVYLAQYQAIAFKPAVAAQSAPTSFQMGMKVAITGKEEDVYKPSNASVRVIISNETTQSIKTIYSMMVSGSAEQFYDLSKLLSWTKAENEELYIADYTVIILNDSDAVLSLTTFKTAFATPEIAQSAALEVTSSRRTLNFAAKSIRKVLTSADTSTLDITWLTQDLTVGAEAVLSVTTSDEIVAVSVGDAELTEYTQNADGTRTWIYNFTVTENSDGSYDVVLKDAFGRSSQAFTTAVPLAPVPETPDDPTDPTDPTEPTEPTEPSDPTEPTNPTDPTEPSNPTEPSGPSAPAEEPGGSGGGSDNGVGSLFRRLINWLREMFQKIIRLFGD